MKEKVGVGFIGCGNMGRAHAQIMKTFPEVHLRGFADVRAETAERLCEEVGGEYHTTDVERVLNDRAIDLVLVCTHHDSHAPLCVEAAKAGKHIFVEKPLALTIEECIRIERAVDEAGVKLLVGFQARFSPFVRRLKEAIPHPFIIFGQMVDPRWPDESWANDPVKGGGNVLSQGCHTFDLICWFSGSEPSTVYAGGGNFTHPCLPIVDGVMAVIGFENGAVAGALIGDCGANPLTGKAFYELYAGDKVGVLYGYYAEPKVKFWGTESEEFTIDDLPPEKQDWRSAHGYVDMLRAWIDWVGKEVVPFEGAKARDGTRATALGIKAIKALREGCPQRVWE